ncbi:MAG: tryptophan 7-halogenase [Gemmatimonadetes bacterium]|nr:tryptophan 7-halogenase [Gemmatimonadota bacterium]
MIAPGRIRREADAVIVGGGPAGAACARLLAAWGHSVLLLTKSREGRPSLAESIPPSTHKLFAQLGILEEVGRAGFYPSRGNTSWWDRPTPTRTEFAAGESGWQVVRREFDAFLLDKAEEAGAEVWRDVVVRGVEVTTAGVVGATVRFVASDGQEDSVRARYVLDCSGRAGVLASQGLRQADERWTTTALVGIWRREAGWQVLDEDEESVASEGDTLVESYADGWLWSVPVSPHVRYVAAMVDPRDSRDGRAMRSSGLEAMYRSEIGKTNVFARMLAAATLVQTPWARGAACYGSREYAGRGFLLVGDAASFIDPLSSYGVKKALASAWVAAVVVNTCLTRPEREDAALELHDSRERRVYASYQRQAARFYLAGVAAHPHPFWIRRAGVERTGERSDGRSPRTDLASDAGIVPDPATEAGRDPDDLELVGGAEPQVELLRRDPDVLAAFAALRASPAIGLRPGPALRRVRRPLIQGREVVLEECLASPAMPQGIRFLRGIDLPRLVAMAGDHSQVPDLYEAYCRAERPVILPDFLGALSLLLGKGMLENSASEKRSRPAD